MRDQNLTNWYETAGPAEGPVVVLVHGSVVNRACWQPQADALAGQYRLLIPDLPGHGALSEEPFHFERAVDLLRLLVDQEAGGRVVLVGVSLGGHVATIFAARCPEKVAGLVISGASMNFHGAMGVYVRAAAALMTRVIKPEKLYRQAVRNMQAKWPPEIVQAQVEKGISPLGAAQSFAEIGRYDFRALLSSIPAPVLIANGESDRANRSSEAAFAAAAPNARVAFIPGAGHACSIENPFAYNHILLDFLRETLGPGQSSPPPAEPVP